MAITGDAMKGLRAHLKFTQLRFHCSKKRGNTFHVITAPNSTLGEAVVRFFSAETDVHPFSCNSFKRMSDDNSKLAVKCENGEKVTEAPWSESGVALKHRLRKECTTTWRSFTEADMSGLKWMDIYSAMTMQMVHSMKCPPEISSKSMFVEAYWGEIFTLSLNHFERLNDIFSKRFSFWRSQQIAFSVF